MDSKSRIIEVVLGTEFSDYDRRMGDNKTRPKNWCRQFVRPRKVPFYDSLDRLANASERTANCSNWKSTIPFRVYLVPDPQTLVDFTHADQAQDRL